MKSRPKRKEPLYHVSERAGIRKFNPRPGADFARPGAGFALRGAGFAVPSADFARPGAGFIRQSDDSNPRVWAISGARLHNYLLPRDCPRVTRYALPETSVADRREFLDDAESVVAIEAAWLDRSLQTALSLYTLPAESFDLQDAIAGYYISEWAVEPLDEQRLPSALEALIRKKARTGLEVRVLPELWRLREAVASSTLGFSIIRFRNAGPAPSGFQSRYPVPGRASL